MNYLYFTVGLPGSGKSTWIENHMEDAVVHSSDAIREEFGDINDQSRNERVFKTLNNRVKSDLAAGKDVIVDQTGLVRKRRIAFLENIKAFPCRKICILFATPYEVCVENDFKRDRNVTRSVIDRMIKSFSVPCKQEGWDEIQIVWWDYKKGGIEFNYLTDLEKWRMISHDNPHHSLSIGDHMIEASKFVTKKEGDYRLLAAVLMHDCGKPFTKGFVDSKGNPSDVAHFYGHDNVSSYFSLFYLKKICLSKEDILYISLLIGLHMKPFLAWSQSERAKIKDSVLYGSYIIRQVEILHECDLAAH